MFNKINTVAKSKKKKRYKKEPTKNYSLPPVVLSFLEKMYELCLSNDNFSEMKKSSVKMKFEFEICLPGPIYPYCLNIFYIILINNE